MNKKFIIVILFICIILIIIFMNNQTKNKVNLEVTQNEQTIQNNKFEIDEATQEYVIKDEDGIELRRTDNPELVDILLSNPEYNPNPLGVEPEE